MPYRCKFGGDYAGQWYACNGKLRAPGINERGVVAMHATA
jgi:hypothetical protein